MLALLNGVASLLTITRLGAAPLFAMVADWSVVLSGWVTGNECKIS